MHVHHPLGAHRSLAAVVTTHPIQQQTSCKKPGAAQLWPMPLANLPRCATRSYTIPTSVAVTDYNWNARTVRREQIMQTPLSFV
jgi:hypothetical protein